MFQSSDFFSREMTHLSQPLLKKAILAKEAHWKYQRLSLLATAWKIEELKRQLSLMEGFEKEKKESLDGTSQDLELFESLLSLDTSTEVHAEREQLLCIYDDDILKFSAIDDHLNHLVHQLPSKD